MAAKVRPCLILSIHAIDANDCALVTIVPHTTSTRGSRFEVVIPAKFLNQGAFDSQNIVTISNAKLIRRLGVLSMSKFQAVEASVKI